jgi:paraquat-inducible protein B
LMQNLASLDIKSIETNVNTLLVRLDSTVGRLNMSEINQGITNLLGSIDRLITSPEITNDLVAVRTTLDQYRLLGEKLNTRVDPLADSLTNSLAEANRALAQIRGAGENLRTLLGPDAPLPNNLDQALQQLSGAVQSLSVLLDFLKQHPNALITGRERPLKKP